MNKEIRVLLTKYSAELTTLKATHYESKNPYYKEKKQELITYYTKIIEELIEREVRFAG